MNQHGNNAGFRRSSKNRFSNNRRNKNKSYKRKSSNKIDRNLYINNSPTIENSEKYQGLEYKALGLNEKLLNNVLTKGYRTTTEIQEKTIPEINKGLNVLGISKTGSGKTAAFLIPLIEKMIHDQHQKLLVVAPTRELAMQIKEEAVTFVRGMNFNVNLIIGGDSIDRQVKNLKRGDNIIIGTPGRIKDLVNRGFIKPANINNVVVDEVDRMMDMGFINDTRHIFNLISKNKQALFFSATLNKKVEEVVKELAHSYTLIKLSNNEAVKSVNQSIVKFNSSQDKFNQLFQILNNETVRKAIIFVETKHYADKVYRTLLDQNHKVNVIHGNKRQNARKKVIESFRKSNIDYLVATNVAARGIDVQDITHVINFDEPDTYDEYIHRIGRTGRNGKIGTAFTFIKA